MNNKTKRVFISVIIIFIVIISIIIFIRIRNNKELAEDPSDRDIMPEELIEEINNTTGKIIKVENYSDIITVSACLGRFYDNYYAKEKTDQTRQKVYNMLSDEYKEAYNISVEDINSDISYDELKVEIYRIYYVTNYSDMSLYFVNGLIRDRNYESVEFNNIVVLDKNTYSFEVYLDNYLADNGIDIDNMVLEKEYTLPENVETNEDNSFLSSSTTMEDYAYYLFTNLKRAMIYNSEYISEMLSEDSSMENTSDINNFYENNKREIILAAFSTYEAELVDGVNIINCYSKDDKLCFRFYMDAYSKFTFDAFLI